jgi:hypothetical protein
MVNLSFAHHVYQYDASQNCLCSPKRFGSQHLPYPTFDSGGNAAQQGVQILTLPAGDGFLFWFIGVERGQGNSVGTAFIDGYPAGSPWWRMALRKQRSRGVPSGGQQKADGLTCRIDCTVMVNENTALYHYIFQST